METHKKELHDSLKRQTWPHSKLTRDSVRFVVKELALYTAPQQIANILKKDYNIEITGQALWAMGRSRKWKPIIDRMRRMLYAQVMQVPIANKLNRLMLLQDVYNQAMTPSFENSSNGENKCVDLKAANKALEQAQKEIEGDKAIIALHKHNHYEFDLKTEGMETGELIQALSDKLSKRIESKSRV